MKCQSCTEEISPRFSAAIAANTCPMCGGEIMTQTLRDILTAMREIFTDGAIYMDEIADWLQTNHNFRVVTDSEIVLTKEEWEKGRKIQFPENSGRTPRPIRRRGEGDDEEDDDAIEMDGPQPPAPPLTDFAKRAGIKKLPPQNRKMIDFINSGTAGAAHPSEFQGVDDEGQRVDFDRVAPLPPGIALDGLFDQPLTKNNSGVSEVLEMEKLKRLQRSEMSSGKGKINTNGDGGL